MADSIPSRIKPNLRSPVPLPLLPKLSESLQHAVATKDDISRMDAALADWFNRFQSALELNFKIQQPIDCGVASLGRTKIQLRRGLAADWTKANPVLADGEIGIESDTGQAKIGDGSTPWATRPYAFP